MYRDFQNRLAMKHEMVKRKVIDNNRELAGEVSDCIRLRLKRNDEGDIDSVRLEKADVISVQLPSLKDIPYRRVESSYSNEYKAITLMSDKTVEEALEISCPYNNDLNPDDLIIKVFIDGESKIPTILPLKVNECLGTFGTMMLISSKYKASIYSDKIPDKIMSIIIEMAKRRLEVFF